jgi:hypothetical protein
MELFRESTTDTDQIFETLRNPGSRDAQTTAPKELLGQELARQARLWARMLAAVKSARSAGLDLHRKILVAKAQLTSDTLTFLAFDKNNGNGPSMPLELLLRFWLGLGYGIKTDAVPEKLNLRFSFPLTVGSIPMKAEDILLVMLPNGGFIRGEIMGWRANGQVVLRDLLPNAFSGPQQQLGQYRILDLKQAARLELIRIPLEITSARSAPVLTSEGDYSKSYVRPDHLFRIEIQPTDLELLTKAREGQHTIKSKPTLERVNVVSEQRPRYVEIPFLACKYALTVPRQ